MTLRGRLAFAAALLFLPLLPAAAQGVLDSLFGPARPSGPHSAGEYRRSQPALDFSFDPLPAVRSGWSLSPFGYEASQPHDRGAYRTLCVRMCDGFYFPISYATSSSNFAHDAEKCAASCGSKARLFFHPNPGGDVETMLDLTGRIYSSYPTAFKYRKALVPDCRCRPQPWTEVEHARHRAYSAAQSLVRDTERIKILAGGARQPAPGSHTGDTPQAVIRPEPLRREAGQWTWSAEPGTTGRARSPYGWPGIR